MKTLDEKEVLVDTYRKWERSHNRENYGRLDKIAELTKEK